MTSLSMGESSLNLAQAFKEYKWYNSCNVTTEVQCNIVCLELPVDMKLSTSTSDLSTSDECDDGSTLPQDMYISAQIICNQIPTYECPISTCFGMNTTTSTSIRDTISWNDLLSFPIKYRDLSKDAILVLTAYSGDGKRIVGGTSIPLFDENDVLKKGKQKLIFYFNHPGDTNVITSLNATPGQLYDSYAHVDDTFKMEKLLEAYHYNHQINNINSNNNNKNSDKGNNVYDINCQTRWLDKLTLSRLESALNLTTGSDTATTTTTTSSTNIGKSLWGRSAEELDLLHLCCLVIELPVSDYPIIFEEKVYPCVQPHFPLLRIDDVAAGCVRSSGGDLLAGVSGDESVNGNSSRGGGILEFSLISNNGHSLFNPHSICVVADWELDMNNLAEAQYRCLAHDSIRGAADPKIKPNLQEKEFIDRLVSAAGDRLTNEEMDVLYKFRYALTDNKKALIKLLCSINWSVESEVKELPVLLSMWKTKAPIDVSDALKLLGREKSFQHPMVRQYAVQTLQTASDEELSLYLLQLVQALRYEPEGVFVVSEMNDEKKEGGVKENDNKADEDHLSAANRSAKKRIETIKLSPLAHFLIQRACASAMLANSFYWFVKVELKDPISGNRYFNILQVFLITLNQLCSSIDSSDSDGGDDAEVDGNTNNNNNNNDGGDDEKFNGSNNNFSNSKKKNITKNSDNSKNNNSLYQQILAQDDYITNIIRAQQDAKNVGGAKPQKEAELRKLLHVRHLAYIPSSVTYLPNPLDPTIKMIGLVPSTATMFKSAVYPCVIDFITTTTNTNTTSTTTSNNNSGSSGTHAVNDTTVIASTSATATVSSNVATLTHMHISPSKTTTATATTALTHTSGSNSVVKIMFKSGDDLRQDQLVMQLMQLMDRLLRKVNLNLQLLTYKVLAVTHNDGIMEFVADSYAFSAILAEYRTVQSFLKKYNPDIITSGSSGSSGMTGGSGVGSSSSCYGISPVVMDTYVKSCAASCVLTFILGIGDRHLDNIMMTKKGQLFHIDFGFIFGQDPKPLPPPFRFTREMCDGMGGEDSVHYDSFKGYCCQAYNWLRKSANLILNLLSLMGDAGIEDISQKSDIHKVLARVEEKFRLDLTDEMAEQYFLGLINESLNAFAPRVMEVLHQIAVKRR